MAWNMVLLNNGFHTRESLESAVAAAHRHCTLVSVASTQLNLTVLSDGTDRLLRVAHLMDTALLGTGDALVAQRKVQVLRCHHGEPPCRNRGMESTAGFLQKLVGLDKEINRELRLLVRGSVEGEGQ